MAWLAQRLVPGIVGISTYVDFAYAREMQLAAMNAAGTLGPVNQLMAVTVTLDFRRLIDNVRAGRLAEAESQVADTCEALEAGGADFIVVTSGTTSTLTGAARERVAIPFLDLAESAWNEIGAQGGRTVGLLSTQHAAAGGIFQAAASRHGDRLLTPAPETAARVDEVIFDELTCGLVSTPGVDDLRVGIAELAEAGARTVILGNTDMTLATEQLAETAPVPLIDSARTHARAAARVALEGLP